MSSGFPSFPCFPLATWDSNFLFSLGHMRLSGLTVRLQQSGQKQRHPWVLGCVLGLSLLHVLCGWSTYSSSLGLPICIFRHLKIIPLIYAHCRKNRQVWEEVISIKKHEENENHHAIQFFIFCLRAFWILFIHILTYALFKNKNASHCFITCFAKILTKYNYCTFML